MTLDYAVEDAALLSNPPWFAWSSKHDLLLADPDSGGLLKIDPTTNKRSLIGDTTSILNSLHAAGAPRLSALPTPDAVDPEGRRFAFIQDNKLYLVDSSTNTALKIADSRFAMKNVTFSPDAKSVAYVRDNDLYVSNPESTTTTRLTNDGRRNLLNGVLTWMYWEEIYNHHDQAYWWSPDSKYIAYFRTDESNVPNSVIVDFRPQYPATLTQCYPKPGNPNPKVSLGVVPAAGGQAVFLDPLKDEDGYIVGVKWSKKSSDDSHLLYQVMNRAQSQVSILDLPENALMGSPETIFTDEDPKYIDVNDDFEYVQGGKGLIVASARNGYEQLYWADPSSRDQAAKPLITGKWQVLPAEPFDPNRVCYIDHEADWIYFTGDRDSVFERALYRMHSDGGELSRITKERGTHDATFSPDGQFFVDTHSNRDTPPTEELRSCDGRLVETLDKPDMDVLNMVSLSPEKSIEIPARDGFRLPATIRTPRNMAPGRRYPVIMEVYGGPEAPTVNDEWNASWAVDQLYAENGFIVVHVDNRSSTVGSKRLATVVKGHFYGGSERNDFVDAALWLKDQAYVDPNRIGIKGWSGGGGNVLNCMCRSTEFKAGMAGAPYVDPSFYDSFYSERLFGLPKADPQAYADARLWEDAKNLHGKLLMMWGTGDDNVHNQHDLKFVDELISAGKSVQIMLFPMRKHELGDLAADKMALKTALEFFKANL